MSQEENMKAKSFLIVLFVSVVMALTLFMTEQARAFSDEPCYALNDARCAQPEMSQTNGGWTVELSPQIIPRDGGYYEWTYTFSLDPAPKKNPFVSSNFVAFLIPDCCNDDDKIEVSTTLSDPGNLSVCDVGEGEPTIGFGRYNQQAYVLKGTPDSTGTWKIVANTNHVTRSTIIIKSGSDITPFEMAVPGCPLAPTPPPIGGRTHSECISTGQETDEPFSVGEEGPFPADHDDVSFYIVRNLDQDGCIERLWACNALYCPGCTNENCPESSGCALLVGEQQGMSTVLEASLLLTCPTENFSIETGSPYYKYTWNSGGLTYVKCLDLATYQWVNPSFCGVQ